MNTCLNITLTAAVHTVRNITPPEGSSGMFLEMALESNVFL